MIRLQVPNTTVFVTVDDDVVSRLDGYGMSLERKGYVRMWPKGAHKDDRPLTRLHVFVAGQPPNGWVVDHINGDKSDNRRCNLRHVSLQQNQVNRKRLNRNNRSGVRGVYFCALRSHLVTPWKAAICVEGRTLHIGYFDSVSAAAQARHAAELKYFGELCPTSEAA